MQHQNALAEAAAENTVSEARLHGAKECWLLRRSDLACSEVSCLMQTPACNQLDCLKGNYSTALGLFFQCLWHVSGSGIPHSMDLAFKQWKDDGRL